MFTNLFRAATGGITPWLMLATFLIGMFLGSTAMYWKYSGEVERLKREKVEDRLEVANKALKDLADASKKINEQAKAGQTDISSLRSSLEGLKKELKNAKPLPPDCVPDPVRVRRLDAAINAVNQAVTGSKPSGTLSTDSKTGDK